MLTFLCAMLLLRRPEYFSWEDLGEGLAFRLPPNNGLATAVAVFGITGVGASELFMYPYWCVEKGYARYAGRSDGSSAWRARALGWIRVMHTDIVASMVIYTVATIAFYLLGAGILHGMGLVPAANDMIPVLSRMYTETLGPWALWLFYAGAIATLYGTIFAATAADSRVLADLMRLAEVFPAGDYRARVRWRNRFVVVLTVLGAGLFLGVRSPVLMVKAGGVAQALMLPVIAVSALYLRYRRLPREVLPKQWITAALWLASLAIIFMIFMYGFMALR
jgi:hypothetical protein